MLKNRFFRFTERHPKLKSWFHIILDACLNAEEQDRLAAYVLHRAKNLNNDDPQTNGEYSLIRWLNGNIFSLKKEQAVVFDVGANVGDWSREILRVMQSGVSLTAFEPSLPTFRNLSENLNSFAKAAGAGAIANQIALSDQNGSSELHCFHACSGTNSLHRLKTFDYREEQGSVEQVESRRGDHYCQEQGIQHIDFLKIDTEGHELAVLLGFEDLLSRQSIDFIQFEYNRTWIDARGYLYDAFQTLTSKGYCLGRIYPKNVKRLGAYHFSEENFTYANYFAYLPEYSKLLSPYLT